MSEQARYCTFRLGESRFALSVADIQEVLRGCIWTRVPRAPAAVLGLMNLRGQIVTVIDLAQLLQLVERGATPGKFLLVLTAGRSSLAFAVDEVSDVVELDESQLQPPPATLDPTARAGVRGVLLCDDGLLSVLECAALLRVCRTEARHVG